MDVNLRCLVSRLEIKMKSKLETEITAIMVKQRLKQMNLCKITRKNSTEVCYVLFFLRSSLNADEIAVQ